MNDNYRKKILVSDTSVLSIIPASDSIIELQSPSSNDRKTKNASFIYLIITIIVFWFLIFKILKSSLFIEN